MIDAGIRHSYRVGLGQGEYCLSQSGQVIPCDSNVVAATIPALPGGGTIPSGQSLQSAPPVTPAPQPVSLWTQLTQSQIVPGIPNMILFVGIVLAVSLGRKSSRK